MKLSSSMPKSSRKFFKDLKFYRCSLDHFSLIVFILFFFRYVDPVDGSKSSNQGLTLFFEYASGDAARVVFRLSGTGSSGATIRMYLEKYEKDVTKHGQAAPVALKSLADRAIQLVKIKELTGRDAPTVIT